jgi:hypothetical protein
MTHLENNLIHCKFNIANSVFCILHPLSDANLSLKPKNLE